MPLGTANRMASIVSVELRNEATQFVGYNVQNIELNIICVKS
jgi:hypothetical protein